MSDLIVSSIGDKEFTSIQSAINKANDGDTIHVESGVYFEKVTVNKNVFIIGSDKGDTNILFKDESSTWEVTSDAEIKNIQFMSSSDKNNNYCLRDKYCFMHITSDAKIENCSFSMHPHYGILIDTDSKCNISHSRFHSSGFANIMVHNNADPIIENCNIDSSHQYGICFLDDSNGTVRNCIFLANKEDGIMTRTTKGPSIESCRFDKNKYGVSCCLTSTTFIKDCTISGSIDSGIFIDEESNPTIENCKISESKEDGIYIQAQAKGNIRNCELSGDHFNLANQASPTVENCDIHSNKICILSGGKSKGSFTNCKIH